MDVGVIGLGQMGRAMAANLLRAGHSVRVWNRSSGPADELARDGATVAATPGEAFAGDAVITMLADDAALRDILAKENLIESAPPTLVHVNMATISVAYAKVLAAAHAQHGSGYVAAPVFGRSEVAVAGKLNIIAAGAAASIERVRPLFEAMGQKVWPMGEEPHRANAVKIAGNYMIAASLQTMAEAIALGRGHGVDAHDLLDVLNATLFGGRVHTNYGAMIADGTFEPAGFKLALGAKDVRLALEASADARVPMPIAGILRDGFLDAMAHGDGDLDWTALSRVTFRHAGQE